MLQYAQIVWNLWTWIKLKINNVEQGHYRKHDRNGFTFVLHKQKVWKEKLAILKLTEVSTISFKFRKSSEEKKSF